MALKNFHRIIAETPPEVDTFVETSMDILDRIHELLDEKFEGKQKLLADNLGKSEAEISKWFNGIQNFTIKTISRLEAAFGARILKVCGNRVQGTFLQLKSPPAQGQKIISIYKQDAVREKFSGSPLKIVHKLPNRPSSFA